MRAEIEKAMLLQLLPQAPPVRDAATYKVLVMIALLSLFNPNASLDQRTSLTNAFTADQLVRFARYLITLTPDDEQKLRNQYNAAYINWAS